MLNKSCRDTFGVGIITSNGTILADQRKQMTTEKGGLIPSAVAQHHEAVKEQLLHQALTQAKISMQDIDLIAISQGPGLPPSLHVGMRFAKHLATTHNKPLIGVNHIAGHLEIGRLLTQAKDPIYLFVSGANTQIINRENNNYYVIGETLDTAIGNTLDKFGRTLGLGFPGGPRIEQLALQGTYIELPYTVKGMDVSFSGILTKALDLAQQGTKTEDLCYSLQETCFAMLIEVTERALAYCDKQEILLIGGVAANKRFSAMLADMCTARKAHAYSVPLTYAADNPVMIAWTGILQYTNEKKHLPIEKLEINPTWRIEDVPAVWSL
ncbi:MAG: KEOPS complex N(6)-L-threonylcarbamoyladenine synthase Kae1 [Nanoarchaeota archaeon]|nr:KEOPS complex N(6)-L-threonylcarbamoyladenine synthase Kae1 [Nanoarchaeota archaeon]